jgi:hypothetical protein
MNNDKLLALRDILAYAQVQLKKCESAYKGYRAFKGNAGGLVFCTVQLQHAAAALRDHANSLVGIAADIHATCRDLDLPEQLDLDNVELNGQQ